MKHNRSLKELYKTKTRFQEEKSLVSIANITSPQSTPRQNNLNFDTLIKNIQFDPQTSEKKGQMHIKYCKSQKNFDIPSFKLPAQSPHLRPHYIKTERPQKQIDNSKDTQNTENPLSHTNKLNKYPYDAKLKPLATTNRIVNQQQEPKKPKILNKSKQLSFCEEFKIGKVLGKGRFGNVYRVEHTSTNFLAAVKKISLEKVCKKLVQRLTWEIKIQSFLKNEHCLQLYKCYKQGNNLYLLVQLGDCSLFDMLREKRYFTQVQTCYYVTQTIKALIHMHENGIIHRDLKPENIVLVNNVVKLADFGWSIFIGKNSKRRTFCGTLDYVSPQIVLGNEYDEMVDVWSIGVLCYELCTGHAPFESSKSREDTYRKIVNVELKFPKYLSQDIRDFISRLLTRTPSNRMSLEDAMNHQWVRKYFMK